MKMLIPCYAVWAYLYSSSPTSTATMIPWAETHWNDSIDSCLNQRLSLATENTKVFDCLEAMVDIKDPSESILAQNTLLHALNYTALAIALDQLVPIEQWTITPMASSEHAQLSYNPSEVEVQQWQICLFSSSFQLDGSCESKDYLHLLCYRLVVHLKFILEEMGIKSLHDQHKPWIHIRLPASSENKSPLEVRCSTHR